MKAKTRLFGEIDIKEDKIITLENGMIGLPEMKSFTLIYDEEKGRENGKNIMWLQSLDDPETAFPVVNPVMIKEDYNPTVNDELLKPLGTMTPENTFVLVTITVPQQIEEMSINLKAPFVINSETNRGVQLIVEDNYPVKYKIYELLQSRKEKAGE